MICSRAAIREGIGHDGRTLFPLMPYQNYREMPDEDLASVIVYMRTLAPVRNPLPQTEIIFPVKYLIRNAPQPITQPVPQPDISDPGKARSLSGSHGKLRRLPHAPGKGPGETRI